MNQLDRVIVKVKVVKVAFSSGGKLYSYLCDINDIEIGDEVIVEGTSNTPKVVSIEYVHPAETNYPFEKMKHVLSLADGPDKTMILDVRFSDDSERSYICKNKNAKIGDSVALSTFSQIGVVYDIRYCRNNHAALKKLKEIKIIYEKKIPSSVCKNIVDKTISININSGTFYIDYKSDDSYYSRVATNFTLLTITRIIWLPLVIFLIYLNIIIGIIVGIFLLFLVTECAKSYKYEVILEYLENKGYCITWANKTTGTISYSKNGIKHSISVYRGYNSHYRG